MQIGGLGRRHRKPLVVERQIALQEPVGFLQGRDLRQPPLRDHPIVEGVEQPLDPPLGLRRVGRDQLDAQFTQRPPKLTRGLRPGQLVFHGGLGRSAETASGIPYRCTSRWTRSIAGIVPSSS